MRSFTKYALPLAVLVFVAILGNFAFAPPSDAAVSISIYEIADRTFRFGGALSTSALYGLVKVGHPNSGDILLNLQANITGTATNFSTTYLQQTVSGVSFARRSAASATSWTDPLTLPPVTSTAVSNASFLFVNATTAYTATNYTIYDGLTIGSINITSSIVSGSSTYSDKTSEATPYILAAASESTLAKAVTLRMLVNFTNTFYSLIATTSNPSIYMQFATNSTNQAIVNITSLNSALDCNSTGADTSIVNDTIAIDKCGGLTGGYFNCFNITFRQNRYLGAGNSTWCYFNISFTSGTNFNDNALNVSLEGYTPTYAGGGPHVVFVAQSRGAMGGTWTGLTSSGFIVRGPVKQGIDMKLENSIWYVRGFMQSMANSSASPKLQYNVTRWTLYQVLPNGTINTTNSQSGASGVNISATSEPVYTTWKTLGGSKEFWATAFDWTALGTEAASTSDTSGLISRQNWFAIRILNIDNNTMESSGAITANTWNQTLTVKPLMSITTSHTSIVADGTLGITLVGPNETATHIAAPTLVNMSNVNATTQVHWWNGTVWNQLCTRLHNTTHNIEINITQDPVNPTSGAMFNKSVVAMTTAGGPWATASRWKNSTCSCENGTTGVATGNLCPTIAAGDGSSLTGFRPTITGLSPSGYDMLRMTAEFLGPSLSTSGSTLSFSGNSTAGTSASVTVAETLTGVTYTSAESSKTLRGWKDLRILNPNTPTVVSTSIHLNVSAESGKNISGIYFIDYVPAFATNFSTTTPPVQGWYYNGSSTPVPGIGWNALTAALPASPGDYNVTYIGNVSLPDGGTGMAFVYNHSGKVNAAGGLADWKQGTFTLGNNDELLFNYTMNLTSDAYVVLPTLIFGLDPDTGESFKVDLFKRIRIEQPAKTTPIVISEGKLELAKFVTLGVPAYWAKAFEVHNPNAAGLHIGLSTDIFIDALRAEAVYTNAKGEEVAEEVMVGGGKASWETTLEAMETRSYVIKVFTPPVTEVSRSITDLKQVDDETVLVTMEISLKNLAEEPYENVRLYLPVDSSKIESVIDDEGQSLQYVSGGAGTTIVRLSKLEAQALRQIVVKYKQGYPVIVITPDQPQYSPDSTVGLSILVINGGQRTDKPYIETEVYSSDEGLIYSAIQQMGALEPAQKAELTEKFHIPLSAPTGKYIVNTRFREDFSIISQGVGTFSVAGGQDTSHIKTLMYIALILFSAVMLYVSGKRFGEIRERAKTYDE